MPTFQQAKRVKDFSSNVRLQSLAVADPKILRMCLPNTLFQLQNAYKFKAEQEKHLFTVHPDRPDLTHAREVDHNISDVSATLVL